MNPFMLSNQERMMAWRALRNELTGYPEEEQLKVVAKWWAQTPLGVFSIDWDQPSTWPGPWELLNDNAYCSTAVAYLMEQTLVLSGWNPTRLKLLFVRSDSDQRLVLVVDNQYVLNYSHGELFDMDGLLTECDVLSTIILQDGKHREL